MVKFEFLLNLPSFSYTIWGVDGKKYYLVNWIEYQSNNYAIIVAIINGLFI
jgi:hypothetical protein